MRAPTRVALLATLICGAAWGQEINAYGATMAQLWKSETPGFNAATYAPLTQYLGIDTTNIGTERLSLHLFGWGRVDLNDQSAFSGPGGGKNLGELTYGYLLYRFPTANAEIKAGRFTVNQAVGSEQIDGVSARADLRGGFTVSAFGGQPVLYKNPLPDLHAQKDYEFQRNFIVGARIGLRVPRFGEFGLSYLQDGQSAAKDLPIPSDKDYSRRQFGVDLRIAPVATVDFSGRTIFDAAKHPDTPAGQSSPSNIAEHDYLLAVKPADQLGITASFTERNFRAYYAGTNLHSLFNQNEAGKFNAYGLGVTYGSAASFQLTADFRHTKREIYGEANRFGVDGRWAISAQKLVAGFGLHRVTAADAVSPDPESFRYGMSRTEARAWVMTERGALSASLDGIYYRFDDATNPNLSGKTSLYEFVGSVGYQVNPAFKVSGDLGMGADAVNKIEVRGLLRAEYRFGTGSAKGGKK